MGAPTRTRHPSAWLFERARRALGLRCKMAVISVAEVGGTAFYGLLAARVPSPVVAEVARVIEADEPLHLDFQRDYSGEC